MIVVRCVGHIASGVGTQELELAGGELSATELVEKVREASGKTDPGFTKFNTMVMVEDGEAFVPAGSDRKVLDGSRVVLIPFSHGG